MKTLMNALKLLTLSICLVFSNAYAQQGDSSFAQESLKDITTIAGLGGVGAVLGLSTLSFVEEPGDHLQNIVVGGAIGIIIGVGVVAYSQASKSQNFYQSSAKVDPEFNSSSRYAWHVASREIVQTKSANQVNFSFKF
ncbi:MAG: hypothetical protein CME69_04925 [Halobacteriovorax sp.]|nr:hypothetical protein [Halobacteriovorax sp.]|tara:strand:- start:576 stop:989 length:414 start_codon:yes stop_codon:yes gene_type:complete